MALAAPLQPSCLNFPIRVLELKVKFRTLDIFTTSPTSGPLRFERALFHIDTYCGKKRKKKKNKFVKIHFFQVANWHEIEVLLRDREENVITHIVRIVVATSWLKDQDYQRVKQYLGQWSLGIRFFDNLTRTTIFKRDIFISVRGKQGTEGDENARLQNVIRVSCIKKITHRDKSAGTTAPSSWWGRRSGEGLWREEVEVRFTWVC